MGFFESERLYERKRGSKRIEELKSNKDKSIIVHYSCESFFNLHGRSPRIITICVKNRGSNCTKIFSVHLQAQIRKKDLQTINDADFDLLEKEMLKSFYTYLKKYCTYKWIHWNMRNASYGFEAIANRYRILGGTPSEVLDEFKYDLPDILGMLYTYKFEEHKPDGQLLNLAQSNNVSIQDAMNGKKESEAFNEHRYLALQMSTSRKVEIIDRILTLEENKQLKVKVKPVKIYGLTPEGIFEMVRNNWVLFAIWSIIMSILGMALEPVVQNLFGTSK